MERFACTESVLTVPDGNIVFLHKRNLAIVHLPDIRVLVLQSLVSANAVRESEAAVVVDRIHGVGEHLGEAGEVHAEGVALEEENMIWVDLSDGWNDAIVEGQEPCPLDIGGLIKRVESCDPRIALVALCENLP